MARDSTSGKSRADRNRAIRQEELRKYLAAGKHIEHVEKMIKSLMDSNNPVDDNTVRRFNAAITASMKLVDKYLPDLKSVEHTGEVETGLSELLKQASDLRAQRDDHMEPEQDKTPSETTKH
ncbi:MAG: hypothetical protein AB2689_02155 [Candidatus Thiodiazotropha taylori]